jgi:potassium-transporting ATPase KdpC subunit
MSGQRANLHFALLSALKLFVLLTLMTGVIYPLLVTALAQLVFPRQADGEVLYHGATAIGSHLIGQNFSDPGHFWGRPSATTPQPYNGLASSASNLGPLNPALTDAVRARVAQLRSLDPGNSRPVPVDLVTASASGLDPEISVAAADYQAERVAHVRQLPVAEVRALIATHTEGRLMGVIGEPRINVLELNLALDALKVK